MVTEAVEQMAQEMPEHQTSRGNEFREIPVEHRYPMAQKLVQGRSQASAENADWSYAMFRYHMRQKKELYFYYVGKLGIDFDEARAIWWSVVYDDPSAAEQRDKI